jgi:hypothetical protein
MGDDQPVPLDAVCNAGVSVLGERGQPGERGRDVPVGQVLLRGLPFLVGSESSDPERCFVVPGSQEPPVMIEVGAAARRLIVAHRQLRPGRPDGHGVGLVVAEYAVHLAGDLVVEIPIRERFEIQTVPGRHPYLAVTDHYAGNMARFEGPWELAGYRLAEHTDGGPTSYYLWCWENPEPDRLVERVELRPRGLPFLVAGVTVSNTDEHPFVRSAGRPVRLLVNAPGVEAAGWRPLEIEVDRGVATYPQPLPGADDRPGYGAADLDDGPRAGTYATVAAIPSATVALRCGDRELGAVTWGDVERDGHASTADVHIELVDPGRNWVHVQVLDDATGRPVPCRVHFRSPEGIPYQPHGHPDHVARNLDDWNWDVGGDVRLGAQTYAYIDGTCQGWLPRGELVVDIARGFEYAPLRQTVHIEPGQDRLTVRLRRIANMAAQGWWSGDCHVHFLSTTGAQLEQLGEDLRVVNLLGSQWGALFSNVEDFIGGPVHRHSTADDGAFLVYVGQENRQHVLGHLTLLGLEEPVMPWCSDGPEEAELGGALDTTLSDWADRTHAQGGTVVVPHFPNPNGEPAVLVATGRADAIELTPGPDRLSEYYRYLNCGYQLPVVGGTDKMSSRIPVGLHRTYVRLDPGEELAYDGWCRGIRLGRTFMTTGPLLNLTVDGAKVGDMVDLARSGAVTVEAAATGIFPLRCLELVVNGDVVATAEAGERGRTSLTLREELRVDRSSWIAARVFGTERHLDEFASPVFAHTSPVYVACGGPWAMADPEGHQYLRTLVEGGRDYVRHTAVRRADDLTSHHHGEPHHLAWLERPFDEALRSLDGRQRRLE